jgi:biopolymer transport protein ExbB
MKKSIIAIVIALVTPATLMAQVVQNTGAENKPVPGGNVTILEFIMKGGVFIIPIAFLLFYTIYLVIERYRYIKRATKYNPNMLHDVRMSLEKGNVQDALSMVEREPNAYSAVIAEGLYAIGRPAPEIESNMDKVASIEIAKMEKGMSILSLIAGIAPTFGFIGTIAGVIKIFYNISISENVSIGNISGGLYEKMISSGAGLVVGIIAYSSYHVLNVLIDKYVLTVQKTNLDFQNIIQRPGKWQ